MVLNEQSKNQILDVFRFVRTRKDEAKEQNALANESLKNLAESLEVDKSVVTDVYRKWEDEEGEGKLDDVITIFETIKSK